MTTLPDTYEAALAELKLLETELRVVLARAEADGGKVVAIEAVRQVLEGVEP